MGEDDYFLEDDDYDEYVAKNFGRDGRLLRRPPVGLILFLLILGVLIVAGVVLSR